MAATDEAVSECNLCVSVYATSVTLNIHYVACCGRHVLHTLAASQASRASCQALYSVTQGLYGNIAPSRPPAAASAAQRSPYQLECVYILRLIISICTIADHLKLHNDLIFVIRPCTQICLTLSLSIICMSRPLI